MATTWKFSPAFARTPARVTLMIRNICAWKEIPLRSGLGQLLFVSKLSSHMASATFTDADHAGNIAAQSRMVELAGSPDRVIPGHDILQFQKFPTDGRVATIKPAANH